MQRIGSSIAFTCPRCGETFELDHVGEHQLATRPICGTEFITILKNQALLLEASEFNQENPNIREETAHLFESKLR